MNHRLVPVGACLLTLTIVIDLAHGREPADHLPHGGERIDGPVPPYIVQVPPPAALSGVARGTSAAYGTLN